MLVQFARPRFGAMVSAPKHFAQPLVCSIFKQLVIPIVMQSCLGGLPAAAVGSPVLFLAPTLLPWLAKA